MWFITTILTTMRCAHRCFSGLKIENATTFVMCSANAAENVNRLGWNVPLLAKHYPSRMIPSEHNCSEKAIAESIFSFGVFFYMLHPIGAYIRAYGEDLVYQHQTKMSAILFCVCVYYAILETFSLNIITFIVNRIYSELQMREEKNNNKMNTNQPRLISYQNISLCKCLCECEMFVYWIWHIMSLASLVGHVRVMLMMATANRSSPNRVP